jgi:hypothetical protein
MRLRVASRPLAKDYPTVRTAVLEAAVREIHRRGLGPDDILVPERRMEKLETPDAVAACHAILDKVRKHIVAGGWSNAHIRNTTRLRSIRVGMLDRLREGDYDGFSLPRAMQLAEALGLSVRLKEDVR